MLRALVALRRGRRLGRAGHDSVGASIGLTLAYEAWRTRPFRADTARTARDAI